MSLDINYNYLIEENIKEWPSHFDIDKRHDPDSTSEKLYDDLKIILFKDKKVLEYLKINTIKNRKQVFSGRTFYTLFINGDEHLLSSDYIGSSVYWAIEKNIKSEQIIDFLKISRRLGGHMLWPRGFTEGYSYDYTQRQYVLKKNCGKAKFRFLTINEAKGGSEGFYDRFDWTLVLLQIYFECMDDKKDVYLEKAIRLIPEDLKYQQHISRIEKMYYAFSNSKQWIQKFDSFTKFCEVFSLFDSFVDDKSNVILMADLFPILPIDYNGFIKNTCNAINKRNEQLYRKHKI